jgi:hypothetical protein
MATDTPLSHLALLAASVADDLGYVALADLARAVGDDASGYRVIGGHMVTVLAARWMLGADLYRETGDADLGVTPVLARSIHLPGRLKALGYEQVAGNRFARRMSDIPVTLPGTRDAPRQAIIDILIPAYTRRARENVEVSEDLFSAEVPGLAAALGRPAVTMALELRRLNGEILHAALPFPDELSALVLKGLATRVRVRATDTTDIWRCLEIAFTARVMPQDFSRSGRDEAAAVIQALFRRRDGAGMAALAEELGLSRQAADQRFTRIRALIQRVIGPG